MAAEEQKPEQAAPSPSEPSYSFPPIPRPARWKRLHRVVKEIEPWGVLLAVVALLFSLWAFRDEYTDRVEGRTVRAWQLLTTQAPGNSGKIEALEYLNREDGLLCVDRWWPGGCFKRLKERTPLDGIDVSRPDNGTPDDPRDDPAGVYLVEVDLRGASLRGADLTGANLFNANLAGAQLDNSNLTDTEMYSVDLTGANLFMAKMVGAFVTEANLSDTDMRAANLSNTVMFGTNLSGSDLYSANFTGADLTEVNLSNANLNLADLTGAMLSGANLKSVKGLTQQQLSTACGDEHTKLSPWLSVGRCKYRSSVERIE